MQIRVGPATARLEPGDILGVGGEATVYRLGDRAVKVFHSLDPGVVDAKLDKLAAFPRGLPSPVIAPEELVFDSSGRPVGYAMRAVHGAREISHLMKKSFRAGAISNADVCALFAEIHAVLETLHQCGVIAGDLNDGNLLFSGRRVWFIDVDSMQLDGHPCTVGHERYLDPSLYGSDLSARCCFTRDTDWYAFAVLLFGALLFVHPYGGVHPAHPTLLRRAQARASVFDGAVKYPKSAEPWQTLPDPLIERFRAVFERGERGPFPRGLLDTPWTAPRRPSAPRPAIRVNRACRAIPIFATRGRILAAAMQPSLAYVHEEGGVVRREDGSKVMERAADPGMRFAIAGARTWVGLDGKLACIEREQVVDRTVTSGPFDAGSAGCFLQRDGWLIEQSSQLRIGKVLDGQTFLRAGRSLGFGFYRAGRALFSFAFRPGRAGLTDVRLPLFEGKLISADAVFDDGFIAVSLLFDHEGVRRGALHLIRGEGAVVGSLEGPIEEHRVLANTAGRAVQGGRILAATEEGLVLLSPDATGALTIQTIFTDTEPFVEEGAQLLPGPNGSLYVVTTHEIRQLELS